MVNDAKVSLASGFPGAKGMEAAQMKGTSDDDSKKEKANVLHGA
jgi:hypothetical protein